MTRILLVEDDAMSRDMLSRRLQRKGMEVDVAIDGQQAVDMTGAHDYDVVLMDMSLPVIDGYEATRRIRARERTAGSIIIGLSAHAMIGDRSQALQAGCDDYETKPVDLPVLLEKIATLLAGRDRR